MTSRTDPAPTTIDLASSARDAVDLVLDQHERIRELIEAFEACSPRPSKKKDQIVGELITMLVKHARMEELVLYPAVRETLPDLADELDEGIEEHHLADLLLHELDGMSSSEERFDMKVHVMVEAMRHHLDEEEADLLPKIASGLDEARRIELGEQMQKAWQAAPAVPHPRDPQTPPGNVVATVARTVVDRAWTMARLAGRRLRSWLP